MNFTQISRAIPVGACDCHAHIYGPFDQFPLGASAPFQPPLAPAQTLEGLWEAFGVRRGVLIQGSAYGQDHRALLAAIRRDPNNRRGVALVEPSTPDATLKHLQENGVCGARVNSGCWQVVRRIEPLGWQSPIFLCLPSS